MVSGEDGRLQEGMDGGRGRLEAMRGHERP